MPKWLIWSLQSLMQERFKMHPLHKNRTKKHEEIKMQMRIGSIKLCTMGVREGEK